MKLKISITTLIACSLTSLLHSQIIIVNGAASAPYQISLSDAYTQNFDSLANLGSNYHMESNVTLRGWYVDRTTGSIVVAPNAYDSLTLQNYGEMSPFAVITSPDRAFGMIGATYFGLRFANATNLTITGLNVTYDGEQWVRSPNNPQRTDTLYFQYQVFDTNEGQLFGTGWTGVEELNFTSPSAVDPLYAFLDGNAEANRIADIHHLISGLEIAPGQEVWLRWAGIDNPGYNHGLAVDNLRVSFVAIPEPSTAAALIGTLALALATTHRRRR